MRAHGRPSVVFDGGGAPTVCIALTLIAVGCGPSAASGVPRTGDASTDGPGVPPDASADASEQFGTFGQSTPSDAAIAWCDAGPPSAFVLAGVTCGVFVSVPCGLLPGMVPESTGLLAPASCAVLCPGSQTWESCSVFGGDAGAVSAGVVVVCVPDCT